MMKNLQTVLMGCSVNCQHRPLLAAEASYFFLDEKVTKNQVSKEASLRPWLLRGKTDKTTGCVILPPLHNPVHVAKRRYAHTAAQTQLVLSVFTRSFFADGFKNRTNI